jgi:hypothetical protein
MLLHVENRDDKNSSEKHLQQYSKTGSGSYLYLKVSIFVKTFEFYLEPISFKGTQAWNFFLTFFAETESLWSQEPVTQDF